MNAMLQLEFVNQVQVQIEKSMKFQEIVYTLLFQTIQHAVMEIRALPMIPVKLESV